MSSKTTESADYWNHINYRIDNSRENSSSPYYNRISVEMIIIDFCDVPRNYSRVRASLLFVSEWNGEKKNYYFPAVIFFWGFFVFSICKNLQLLNKTRETYAVLTSHKFMNGTYTTTNYVSCQLCKEL